MARLKDSIAGAASKSEKLKTHPVFTIDVSLAKSGRIIAAEKTTKIVFNDGGDGGRVFT
jgi:hypothetical protein